MSTIDDKLKLANDNVPKVYEAGVKGGGATNLQNGEAIGSLKSILATTAVSEGAIALGKNSIAGSKVLEITAVTSDNTTNTSELTVKLSELTETELAMFDSLKEGDKCCVRTSNEFDYISIVSINKANSKIIVDTVVSAIKSGDEYANYICFIDYPNLGNTYAKTPFAYSEGENTIAMARAAHAEGRDTKAIGQYGHTEGRLTIAGYAAHSEGYITNAIGTMAHSEGHKTYANGDQSHAEGNETVANGPKSHAEGFHNMAQGNASHSEGWETTASGLASHTEGITTTAENKAAHAEGHITKAIGVASHSEGQLTEARGEAAHAEGHITKAIGNNSHSEGWKTIANGDQQHVQGRYNIVDGNNKYAHIVGNGSSDTARSNCHTLDWDGNAWFAGDIEDGSGNKLSDKADKDLAFDGFYNLSYDGGTHGSVDWNSFDELNAYKENGIYKVIVKDTSETPYGDATAILIAQRSGDFSDYHKEFLIVNGNEVYTRQDDLTTNKFYNWEKKYAPIRVTTNDIINGAVTNLKLALDVRLSIFTGRIVFESMDIDNAVELKVVDEGIYKVYSDTTPESTHQGILIVDFFMDEGKYNHTLIFNQKIYIRTGTTKSDGTVEWTTFKTPNLENDSVTTNTIRDKAVTAAKLTDDVQNRLFNGYIHLSNVPIDEADELKINSQGIFIIYNESNSVSAHGILIVDYDVYNDKYDQTLIYNQKTYIRTGEIDHDIGGLKWTKFEAPMENKQDKVNIDTTTDLYNNLATLKVNTLYKPIKGINGVDVVLPSAQVGDFIQVDFYTISDMPVLSVEAPSGIMDLDLKPEKNKVYSLYFDWGAIGVDSNNNINEGWRFSYTEYNPLTISE